MTEKLKVEHLTKIFGRRIQKAQELLNEGKSKAEILNAVGATVGVNNASFTVNDGEIFVIMGLSGSGKSTIIRMINRLIEPTSGKISIDGDDLTKLDKKELLNVRRKKMSMVFQNFALFPNRTIVENTAYGLEIQGVDKDTRIKKAHDALELVGLHGYDNQYPTQLSGGMQQRVGLARALANDSQILLMDEAFSALDPLNRKDMQDELLDLQENLHKTIVFISHDLNEALRIGDRIMIMKDGEVVQIGTPEEILTQPADEYVERFIEDVDRTKVLTAANVMIRPNTVNIDKDGPRIAMRRMLENEISSVYVVNNKREFIGIVDASHVMDLIRQKVTKLDSVVQKDVPTTKPDTPITTIMEKISETSIPFAVVDDQKHLLGIIIRGAVLGAISGNEVNADA
ncbi:glycine betaine/L-proline ABC transporter ATP-binding protein [Lentilactobacillus parafarraginis]|jgi:glycine betaine/proline transport system ATP-binding protein|uniref:Quaternary amine transport ATP-binding protein n=3 Tax=Lentilactobacillus parafarraginis TaxID=390842 RepID=A0A0R1YTF6_9LACO|nr:glycine betaine/L-proline ABC transporter ATP-binding protein [Lentilactobacillus parafarraginis]EHL99232.1 putative glycine betaine/L-proline transport ATP-binding protein proV [Lentilactobacillus parafarraginis F0439]KRM45870.1 glycine betaine L-proline transport ATP-binding protein proV [Lentilactobacillus parafarraginis DSM 18390 = JCM 14109]TLQ19136.1 glycine betaine/L-proline ABC transporter ATP-binding protein [Lentilactobacillus parafarraginis]